MPDTSVTLARSSLEAVQARGGFWAVYRNEAMDSCNYGEIKLVQYGPGCTIPSEADLPDSILGWKDRLLGVLSGKIEDENADTVRVRVLPVTRKVASGGAQ